MSSKYLSNHIVIDTGPLIAFAHLGWFDQLRQQFENIYLTERSIRNVNSSQSGKMQKILQKPLRAEI